MPPVFFAIAATLFFQLGFTVCCVYLHRSKGAA